MSLNKILQIIFWVLFTTKASVAQDMPKVEISGQNVKEIVNTVNKSTNNKSNPKELTQVENPNKINTADSSTNKNITSLMYVDEELEKIQEAIDAYKNNQPLNIGNQGVEIEENDAVRDDKAKSYIHLGSILYNSPKNWSVWINDKKISFDNNKIGNELYIKSIDESKANIIWTMSISKWKILTNKKSEEGAPINASNQVKIDFTLGFNQAYTLNSGKITEGRSAAQPLNTTSAGELKLTTQKPDQTDTNSRPIKIKTN